MDWWEERRKFPQAIGFIRTKHKPGSADAHIMVPGGSDDVWQAATNLIAQYEQNLHRQNNPGFRLRRVALLEDKISTVPFCPSPHMVDSSSAPRRFCSLGLCVSHGMVGEIWYILRVERAGNALYWRLDVTERFTPWYRAIVLSLGIVWFAITAGIGLVLSAGLGPIGVVLFLAFLVLMYANRESPDAWWWYIAWPFRLGEKMRQDRLDKALTYAPAVSGALHEATRAMEQSPPFRQTVTLRQRATPTGAAQSSPNAPVIQRKVRN